MRTFASLFLSGLTVVVLSSPAYGQAGGGGLGAGSLGLRNTGPTRGIEPVPAEEAIPGHWRIEFRIRRHSEDPGASGIWRTVLAEMYISGMWVTGRIRGDFPAEFSCTIDESGRCMDGRLRFFTDERDWQVFSFILDRDGDRAEGWASTTDPESGVVREYELQMRKR
jgi:hypothetical protein